MANPISASAIPSVPSQPSGKEEKKNTLPMKDENKSIDIDKEKNLQAAEYETRKAIFGSFEDSIKIFVEMLKHQDPMNPQDPSEMASKFAEFGQVIGLMDVKDELKKSTEMQKNTQMLQAAGQIDKTVEFTGNRFYFSSGKSSEINFKPPLESKYCNLIISTPDHKIVMSKTIETPGGEKTSFVWDGKDYHHKVCDKGTYLIKVTPLDENKKTIMNPKTKQPLEVITYIKDQVSGGIRKNGTAMVMIGGEDGAPYSLENLLAIHSQQSGPFRAPSASSGTTDDDSSPLNEKLDSDLGASAPQASSNEPPSAETMNSSSPETTPSTASEASGPA